MALDIALTTLLDALLDLTAAGQSYIPGEAGEITEYVTTGLASRQGKYTAPVPPLDFVDLVLNLGTALVGIFPAGPQHDKVKQLVTDIIKAIQDGEHAKYMALIGDLIALINDAKALKKS